MIYVFPYVKISVNMDIKAQNLNKIANFSYLPGPFKFPIVQCMTIYLKLSNKVGVGVGQEDVVHPVREDIEEALVDL